MPPGTEEQAPDSTMRRRSFLALSGASAVAVAGSGYVQSMPAAADSHDPAPGVWSSERIISGGTARAWTFDSGAGGWQVENGFSPIEIDSGVLRTTVTGSDPTLALEEIELHGPHARYIRVRMRVRPEDAEVRDPKLVVVFATRESDGLDELKTQALPLTADGELHEYQSDLTLNPLWRAGNVNQLHLRLDGVGEGAQIEIEELRFELQVYSDAHWFVEPLTEGETALEWRAGPPVAADLDGMRDRILRVRVRLTQPAPPAEPWPDPRLGLAFETAESPGFDSSKIIWLHVPPFDGEYHDIVVDLGAEHGLWRAGRITRVQLRATTPPARDSAWDFETVRIERMGRRLAVRALTLDTGSLHVGDTFSVSFAVVNVGAETSEEFEASLTLPGDVTPSDAVQVTVPALEPFAAPHAVSWAAVAHGDTPGVATLGIPDIGFRSGAVVPMVGQSESSAIDDWRGHRVFAHEDGNVVVLSNVAVQAVFVRSEHGFGQLLFRARVGERWQQVATSQPLSALVVAGANGAELLPVVPDSVQIDTGREGVVNFTGSVTDSGGTTWDVRLTFSLRVGRGTDALAVTYQVTPDSDGELISFRGPSLTVGEGVFGASKSAALLPGVEWLVDDEHSSNTLDIFPRPAIGWGSDLRVVPHPLNVTIPLMAVAADGVVVAVQWDTTQTWDGEQQHPSAMFASPNWVEGQNNHLLSLSLPTSAGLPPLGARPDAPYAAVAGHALTATAHYTATVSDDVLSAVDTWHRLYGVPEPAEKPFSFTDELALIRDSYLTSYWVEASEDFHGVHGRGTNYNVLPAIALLVASHLSEDEEARALALERLDRYRRRVVAEKGPQGLSNADNVNVAGWMHTGAFYFGHLEEALPEWAQLAADLIDTQQEGGSWGFTQRNWHDPMLGPLDSPILGRSARNAAHLLRYARLVGDAEAEDAGLRGVEFVNSAQVPRAAQGWEVPLHAPDVLAAAYGVLACSEAYRLTGDEAYADRGRYWVRAALPFLYHWQHPDLPLLPYASQAVMGGSRYRNSWFMRPVQWNGLIHAHHLAEFADALTDPRGVEPFRLDWDLVGDGAGRVAEGLVVSGMHQQHLDGAARGGYPDNWYLIGNKPSRDLNLGSVRIANPLFMVGATGPGGRPIDAQTALLDDGVRLSTAADVRSATLTEQSLTAELGFFAGLTSQLLAAGIEAVSGVSVDGIELAEVASLDEVDEGWKQLADGTVLVALRHQKVSTVVVQR